MSKDNKDVDDGEKKEKPRYGEPRKFNKKFKGPIKNRSCTDIICCILFLIFILGMIVVSCIGFARGNPAILVYPTDSYGNICGYDEAVKDKPDLVYFDILQCGKMGASALIMGCPTPQICVDKCTSAYYSFLETKVKETAGTSTISDRKTTMTCRYGVDPSATVDIDTLIDNKDCASYTLPTTSVVGRCVPSIFLDVAGKLNDVLQTSGNVDLATADNSTITGQAVEDASEILALFFSASEVAKLAFQDVATAWIIMVIFLVIAMVFCFIWIVLLRWLAGILVWISVVAVICLLGGSCAYSYIKYYELKNLNTTAEFEGLSPAFTLNFSYYLKVKQTWLAFGCTLATVLLIFLLILLFLFNRIRIAIELIKEGSKAIGNMIFTLFWPIWPFLLQLVALGYFGVSAVYVASLGESKYYSSNVTNETAQDGINYVLSRTPCTPDSSDLGKICEFVKYGGTEYIIALEVFTLFMFFWVMNFIVAFGQMTLAGAFASYYWAFQKPKDIPAFPLIGSAFRSLRYHLGSLAFGSLIIAIIQIIRVFLEYIDSKLKGAENQAAKFLVKCLKCCFMCLEKIIKFLNRNAYIMIAVYGKNFCTAAKDAAFLILRNIVRVFVLDKITDYVLFLSKLMVTAGVGLGAYFWFQGKIDFFTNYIPKLNYYFTPIIVVILGTYLITCCFFSVYTMAVDTLFLCFLEDLEMHDGSPEKPYFMSKGLMKILGKKNLKGEEGTEMAEK